MRKWMKAIALLLILMMVGAMFFSCNKSDEEKANENLSIESRVARALMNTMSMDSRHLLVDANFNLSNEVLEPMAEEMGLSVELLSLINNADFFMEMKMNTEDPNYALDGLMSYSLRYKEMPLMTFDMFLNDQSMAFSLSNFYDGIFEMNFKDLVEMNAYDETSFDMDFKAYMDILKNSDTESLNEDLYLGILEDHFESTLSQEEETTLKYTYEGKDFESKVTQVVYNFDMEAYMKLMTDMMDTAESDAALKLYVQGLFRDVLTEMMVSKDYESFDLTLEEVQEAKDQLEEEFDEFWQAFFQDMKAEMELALEELESPDPELQEMMDNLKENLKVKMYIDSDNAIRKVEVRVETDEMAINYNLTFHQDGSIVIDRPETTIDVVAMMEGQAPYDDVDKQNELLREVLSSAIQAINSSDAYLQLLEDLRPYEAELPMTVDEIKLMISMAGVMIPEMTVEDLFGFGMDDTSYEEDYDYEDAYSAFDFSELSRVAVLSQWVDPDYIDFIDEDFGVEVVYLEPSQSNLESAIRDGFEMIIVDDLSFDGFMDTYIQSNPDIYFVTLGFTTYDFFDNHLEVEYYHEELGYAAGYIAGLMTESNVIGFLGGISNNVTWNYEAAYEAGALASNPDVILKSYYLENNTDVTLASELTQDLISEGADVLYHHAGSAGKGMVDTAQSEDVYFMNHQSYEGENSPKFLGTTLINSPSVVYDLVSSYGLYSGYTAYGLYNYYLDLYLNLPEEIQEEVFQLLDDIQWGEIYVPKYY